MGKRRKGNKLKSYWSGEWCRTCDKFVKTLGNRTWRRFNKQLCKKELNGNQNQEES